MTDTTPLDLDAIRARAEAATEGPWAVAPEDFGPHTEGDFPVVDRRADYIGHSPDDGVRAGFDLPDAEFIAHARTDVPALVEEVERLRERLDLVTCHVCEEIIIPGEDVLPTVDSWAHEPCMTEGP